MDLGELPPQPARANKTATTVHREMVFIVPLVSTAPRLDAPGLAHGLDARSWNLEGVGSLCGMGDGGVPLQHIRSAIDGVDADH